MPLATWNAENAKWKLQKMVKSAPIQRIFSRFVWKQARFWNLKKHANPEKNTRFSACVYVLNLCSV